jgi:hypothetical protein
MMLLHRALLYLLPLLLASACSAPAEPALPNPFGAFNFTLESMPPAEQVALLEALDYEGMALFWPGTESFQAFASTPSVRRGDFHLRAVLLDFQFEPAWDRAALQELLASLAPHETSLWLILGSSTSTPAARVAAVRELVDLASARGVRVVLYPHEGTALPSVEDALALADTVERPALQVSLHLCHELKAGNRARLAELITRAAPRLALASIHGAFQDTSLPGWSTTILPLDRGDLDVQSEYLLPLARAGYSGPVLLHTFGLEDPPDQHLRRSRRAWEQMQRTVARALADR